MTTSASLERIFFNYIIKKKTFYFKNIEPYYFSNPDIQFVYTVCRDEYLTSKNQDELRPKKIVELVRLQDKDKKISMEVLKALLTIDFEQYGENEEWINQRLEAWRISNAMKSRILESVEYIRNLDTLAYDKVLEVTNKIKEIINDSSTMSMADEDLGSDFDDPDNHVQDSYGEKVTSGYDTMNKVMCGGFDKKTLNIFMGETNVGKCCFGSTYITVRNKHTNVISNIKIEDFFNNGKM